LHRYSGLDGLWNVAIPWPPETCTSFNNCYTLKGYLFGNTCACKLTTFGWLQSRSCKRLINVFGDMICQIYIDLWTSLCIEIECFQQVENIQFSFYQSKDGNCYDICYSKTGENILRWGEGRGVEKDLNSLASILYKSILLWRIYIRTECSTYNIKKIYLFQDTTPPPPRSFLGKPYWKWCPGNRFFL